MLFRSVDRETYMDYDCFFDVGGAVPEAERYTHQEYPVMMWGGYEENGEQVSATQRSEWKFLRKRDLKKEAAGYRYYQFNCDSHADFVSSEYATEEDLFVEVTATYEYEGEIYYELQPEQYYKYALLWDLNQDNHVDIDDILVLRNAMFGLLPENATRFFYSHPHALYLNVTDVDIDTILEMRAYIFGMPSQDPPTPEPTSDADLFQPIEHWFITYREVTVKVGESVRVPVRPVVVHLIHEYNHQVTYTPADESIATTARATAPGEGWAFNVNGVAVGTTTVLVHGDYTPTEHEGLPIWPTWPVTSIHQTVVVNVIE